MSSFKLVDQYLYWWPVKVEVPNPRQSGKVDTQTFEMQFESLPLEEVQAIQKEQQELALVGDLVGSETALLKRACQDWRGVEGDDGETVPFSTDTLLKALRHTYFRTACYAAYSKSLGDKPRLGN